MLASNINLTGAVKMNGSCNWAILQCLDGQAKTLILNGIAKHYGITREEAYSEVTCPDAEYLLDYLTGSERAAASVLIQRHAITIATLIERQHA